MIYLDSSALVKLVRAEAGSAALKRWLGERRSITLLSSVLAEVEVSRAIRRSAPELLDEVPHLMLSLQLVELDTAVRALASSYLMPTLRSADAVHLASADVLQRETGQPLVSFLCYGRTLSAAAAAEGMPVSAPA